MSIPDRTLLEELLAESAQRHHHLCPKQVLGVRLALIGLSALAIHHDPTRRFRNSEKSLLCIAETDGCCSDGFAVATDCAVGRRTLRIVDYGKVAATLIDRHTSHAIRVAPRNQLRQLALAFAPHAESPWHSYLFAYQHLPDEHMAYVRTVRLVQSPAQILSRPDARACCARCGEEIINEREVIQGSEVLCRYCAGERYYEHD